MVPQCAAIVFSIDVRCSWQAKSKAVNGVLCSQNPLIEVCPICQSQLKLSDPFSPANLMSHLKTHKDDGPSYRCQRSSRALVQFLMCKPA